MIKIKQLLRSSLLRVPHLTSTDFKLLSRERLPRRITRQQRRFEIS